MIFELLLGSAAGYFLQPLYYEYVFVEYPITRMAGWGVVPPLVIALVGAWAVDVIYHAFIALFRRSRLRGRFRDHALGISLFVSTFLYIEGMKIGTELRLPYLTSPPTLGIAACFLAWFWVRHRHYVLMLVSDSVTPAQEAETLRRDRTKSKKSRDAKGSREPRPAGLAKPKSQAEEMVAQAFAGKLARSRPSGFPSRFGHRNMEPAKRQAGPARVAR